MSKLLLVDDDVETLTWMAAALESRGHEVAAFRSGREALAALDQSTPDLIVSDVLMPELDGLSFARLVRKHGGVPLMFVSIAKKEAEAVLAGAVAYVHKPATPEEIRSAVARVLGAAARRSAILVVDDEPDARDIYRDILEDDFVVLTAANGVEALEILRSQPVDLAILDVHMPVMNGAELLRAIRADPALEKLPVVIQTSDSTAMKAPIWGALRVSQVVSKLDFLDWFEAHMRTPSEK